MLVKPKGVILMSALTQIEIHNAQISMAKGENAEWMAIHYPSNSIAGPISQLFKVEISKGHVRGYVYCITSPGPITIQELVDIFNK